VGWRNEGREVCANERVASAKEVERVGLHEDEDVAKQHDARQEEQDEEGKA
jgi:hypothetical protein